MWMFGVKQLLLNMVDDIDRRLDDLLGVLKYEEETVQLLHKEATHGKGFESSDSWS